MQALPPCERKTSSICIVVFTLTCPSIIHIQSTSRTASTHYTSNPGVSAIRYTSFSPEIYIMISEWSKWTKNMKRRLITLCFRPSSNPSLTPRRPFGITLILLGTKTPLLSAASRSPYTAFPISGSSAAFIAPVKITLTLSVERLVCWGKITATRPKGAVMHFTDCSVVPFSETEL